MREIKFEYETLNELKRLVSEIEKFENKLDNDFTFLDTEIWGLFELIKEKQNRINEIIKSL